MTEAGIAGQATQPETAARRRGRPPGSRNKPKASATAVKKDTKPHVHHVHFLEDGVTALDRVFVRGEEIQVRENTPWYGMAHDKDGNCLFALSREEQYRKFGKQLWAEGPWPFDPYDLQARLDNGETLTAEEQAVLKKINDQRFKRQPLGAARANRK